jgi:hypothetical protein
MAEVQDGSLEALGTIYAINDQLKKGQIRLFDNRRVEFDFDVVDPASRPIRLKDQVRVLAQRSGNGFVSKSVTRVTEAAQSDLSDLPALSDTGQAVFPFIAPDEDAVANVPTAEIDAAIASESAMRLYEQAAVAKAEERYTEARELFEQAIEVGGGAKVYSAYAKMLIEGRGGDVRRARELLARAIDAFPESPNFYVMYGQMERRAGNLLAAEQILRSGLALHRTNAILRTSLAQVLAQVATAQSLKEAAEIFDSLEAQGKLNKRDNSYTRFRALAANPRAGRTYAFFEKMAGFRPGIPGRRDVPEGASDLVVEVMDQELEASFGLNGAYLVRCFSGDPKRSDVVAFSKYLRSLGNDATLGLITGREIAINPALAFAAIPKTATVRDYLMSVLAEKNEAILPIDEQLLRSGGNSRERLREVVSQYLGSRDLYDSTLPVSGRRLFGREKLLVQLVDQVHRGDFIGIFGLRKMGKTSLVYQLRDEKLKDEAVAYVDLQSSPGLALQSFDPVYWEIEQDLLSRLHTKHPVVKEILRLGGYRRFSEVLAAGINPALLFGEDLRALLSAVQAGELKGVSRVIIVIDELERCLPLSGQAPMKGFLEFFGAMRGLAQTERFRGLISSVVVAANASISERAYWDGRENPVFALYKPLFLPPLSKPDTHQMITSLGKGMSVYWDPDALDRVFVECGGHPFLTRVLCSQITQRNVKRPLHVTSRMVERELALFIRDKSDKFQQIVELLHTHFPEEEALLETLAIKGSLEPVDDQVIKHLLGYHLVKQTKGEYEISFAALKAWLQRRAGVAHA